VGGYLTVCQVNSKEETTFVGTLAERTTEAPVPTSETNVHYFAGYIVRMRDEPLRKMAYKCTPLDVKDIKQLTQKYYSNVEERQVPHGKEDNGKQVPFSLPHILNFIREGKNVIVNLCSNQVLTPKATLQLDLLVRLRR
jgi:hypothetical protein